MPPKARVIAYDQLLRLKQYLKHGGVIAYPTEYCFGLGGLPTHPRAIRTILKLKKRPVNKGLIVVADKLSRFQFLLQNLTPAQQTATERYWPGANTLILPARNGTHPALRGTGHKTLALRVTAHPAPAWLCQQLGSALISTSANVAKAQPVRDIRTLNKQFGHKVWIVNAPLGKNKQASTIIDLAQNKILRGG